MVTPVELPACWERHILLAMPSEPVTLTVFPIEPRSLLTRTGALLTITRESTVIGAVPATRLRALFSF